MATAINDFIQGIIMIFGIIAVIVAVLSGHGGFTEAIKKLAEIESDVPGVYASFFGPDLPNLLGVVVLTSLGTWGLPQMVHKFYTIKDEKSIKSGTIISTLFAVVVSGGCYFLGGFSRLVDESLFMVNGVPVYDAIIPGMLSKLPDILISIVVVLVLSASMSTLSSLVMTSSSTLTLDLIKDNIIKNMSEKKQLLCMRIMLVFFIVVSVVLALDPPTFIAQLMGISWGALAGAFLAPFMYGLYWKGVTKAAVWASFASGVGITVANLFFKFIASPINAGAIAMVAGLIVVPVVSLLAPKMKKEQVDEIFECFEETVTVRKKRSIGYMN
jgi:SSS family solute:Na+ symporter